METSRKGLRRVGIVAAVVVLAGVILRLLVSAGLVRIVNAQLAKHLRAPAHVQSISLGLMHGRVALDGLQIGEPAGFQGAPVLDLPHAAIDVDLGSLLRSTGVVESVEVSGLSLLVQRNTQAVVNVVALQPPPAAAPPAPAPEKTSAFPSWRIEHVELRGLALRYIDASVSAKPLDITLNRIDATVSNLLVAATSGSRSLPGRIEMTARIVQPGRNDAWLGFYAWVGAVGTNPPAVNAAMRLVGLELATLGDVVPVGVAATLGGNAVDVYADLSMSPRRLDTRVTVATVGNRLNLQIGGTPAHPKPDTSSVLFGVVGRLGGGLGHVVSGVGNVGLHVAGTAVETGFQVAKGAGHAVGSVANGLLSTAVGLFSGDMKEAGQGLQKATVGLVSDVTGTVVAAGSTLAEGATETARAGTGGTTEDEWRAAAAGRWQKTWAEAHAWVTAQPYPDGTAPAETAP